MLSLRNRFGIPGVISVIALVFAMFGGAYAASNNSGGGKAAASAKAKRGPRGLKGATGPAGPAGPTGAKGDAGAAGSNGAPGKDGTSVSNTGEPKGANCKEGGTKLVGTSTTFVCNGEKGAKGDEGEPWTDEGTLPPGATETGTWVFTTLPGGPESVTVRMPIAFPIPLEEELPVSDTHFLGEEQGETEECPGTAEKPEAAAGQLCVYATSLLISGSLTSTGLSNPSQPFFSFVGGAGTTGSVLILSMPHGTEEEFGYGTWAVTAE